MKSLAPPPLQIAGALALVASLAGTALAQPPGRYPGFPPGLAEARLIKEMAEEIGVDEKTLAKLDELVAETRAKDEELQDQILAARNGVQALLEQARPDEKELMAKVGVGSDLARQGRVLRVAATLRVRALLTKEQLEKFMEIRKRVVGKRRKGGRPSVR